MPEPSAPLVVGVDTGGTFTDFFAITPEGEILTHKTLSTPDDPGRAVLVGLEHLARVLAERRGGDPTTGAAPRLIHGSTVATNAILERKGAPTAFVTTAGFADLLFIGRQNRRALYDLTPRAPEPLVEAASCFEVRERVDVTGAVVHPLDRQDLGEVAAGLAARGIASVAVVFLHSYANPEHERVAAELFRRRGLTVSASHEILPEHREYERASTTVLNAYVSPLMERYLGALSAEVRARGFARLSVMQSNGGVMEADEAGRYAVHTVLSGPAGGVVGAQRAAAAGSARIITFDMGGTSTDVSLVPGRVLTTTESEIDGMPLRIPVLDIHTVGAGGGSIARVDAGGALTVGPQSAGADPGPACYGRGGGHFTVTDANLLLGRLPERWFMGGTMALDRPAAARAGEALARRLGASLEEAAYGVLRVVGAHMERAVKVISVERGHDPRDFTLVAFGGAGALHAAELARELRIPRVLVPPYPGVLSAYGMAVADVVRTYAHGVLGPLDAGTVARAQGVAAEMCRRAEEALAAEGVAAAHRHLALSLDVRYVRQSFELPVPCDELLLRAPQELAESVASAFHALHRATYGHAQPDEPVELVAVRLRAEGRLPRPEPPARPPKRGRPEPLARSPVYFAGGWLETAIYERYALPAECEVAGPAIVVEEHATTVVPPGCRCQIHDSGALVIEVT